MIASDDMRLLRDYAAGNSEEAFRTLVTRHINLVFSAALRVVNDPHSAEEVAQSVFVILARKSRSLDQATVLSGWLYQTARLTASNFIRTERRRRQREQQAHDQAAMNDTGPEPWTQIGPLLEEAMAELNEKDRDAIVLRFFEGKRLKEVGDALGASEEAAKKRVDRALDKLRSFFVHRGITVPEAVLAAAITGNSIQAAPAGLAASVAAGALQSSVATVSTLALVKAALVKGALYTMASAKISVAIAVGAAAIIALEAHQILTEKKAVQQLQEQFAQLSQTNQAQQTEIKSLQERNASYAKSMEAMSRDAAKSRANAGAARDAKKAAAAASKAAAQAQGNPLAAMFKDPDMRKALAEQSASMMRVQYAPLIKRLNLTDEQADKFYNILIDTSMKSIDAMQSGKLSEMTNSGVNLESQLKSVLGESGYAQYKDFSEGLADQTMMTMMKNNFVDSPLTDQQSDQLLQAMKMARKSAGSLDYSTLNASDKIAMMDQVIAQQEKINQNVLQQAQTFLSPDQLQTLATSQSNFLGMQKFGATMAQKMFSGSNAPSPQ